MLDLFRNLSYGDFFIYNNSTYLKLCLNDENDMYAADCETGRVYKMDPDAVVYNKMAE